VRGIRLDSKLKSSWVLWFSGFFLVAMGWALVTPVNGFPDEVDHVYLAVGVVRGEVFPHIGAYYDGTGAITDVPVAIRSLLTNGPCHGVTSRSHCQSGGPGHRGSVTVVTTEGRNYPLYYALVGWPSLLFAGRVGWYLMRLVSAMFCCAFLAAGVSVLMSMGRRPLVLASGLFVGLTPIAVNLLGSVNPNGLEIASGFCFWAVTLALVHGKAVLATNRLVTLGVLSGVTLASCRILGGVWIALAVAVALTTVGPAERRRFVSSRSAHVVLGSAAGAVAAMAAWTLRFRSYETFYHRQPHAGLARAAQASFDQQGKILRETLAYLGWLSIRPPVAAEVCWTLAVLALVALAYVSNRRTGIVVVSGCVLAAALPFVVLVATFHDRGDAAWQGRYTVPFTVGLAVVAVVPSRRRVREPRIVVLLASAAILFTIYGHIAVFEGAWARYREVRQWYVTVGHVLIGLGVIAVIAVVALAEARWKRQTRERTQHIDLRLPLYDGKSPTLVTAFRTRPADHPDRTD
jgi:Predicted membrane protein (DUF2142)